MGLEKLKLFNDFLHIERCFNKLKSFLEKESHFCLKSHLFHCYLKKKTKQIVII